MTNSLMNFSSDLADAVERVAGSVVTVHGRGRRTASGVVWKQGLVITSESALRADEGLQVTLPSGETVAAALKGRDGHTDLAVLACNTGSVAPATFAAGAVRVGQLALTVGRTRDTGPISTLGMVSGVAAEWKTWRGGKLSEFIRLNADVYPTSVGGAVADAEGNLLGLVAGGLSRSSVIAIPRGTIERVANSLATRGRVARGYLGIGLQAVAVPASLKLNQEQGIMVVHVEENGPAAGAGLMLGDVLLQVGEQRMTSVEALHSALSSDLIGKPVSVQFLRGGAVQETAATVGERPVR